MFSACIGWDCYVICSFLVFYLEFLTLFSVEYQLILLYGLCEIHLPYDGVYFRANALH